MNRNPFYVGIAFFAMINGLPSPLFEAVFLYTLPLLWGPLFGSPALIAYFASLMLSTATVILAGIPAAIYERFVGATDDSTDASLWIWLAGTAILAIPAVSNFLRIGL
jgi:hypothetical protein